MVYGHNDPMAYGAYLAAKDIGREKEINSSALMACRMRRALGL